MANNSEYTLTFKGKWTGMEWQADCVDPSLEDIFEGFYGCLVGNGYDPKDIITTLQEWAQEKCRNI